MIVEFDPDKDAANRQKHGVSLGFGARILDQADALVVPTIRVADEEERFKVIGEVDGALWTGIHVYRGDSVRFMSVRRSNAGEQRAYHSDPGGRF